MANPYSVLEEILNEKITARLDKQDNLFLLSTPTAESGFTRAGLNPDYGTPAPTWGSKADESIFDTLLEVSKSLIVPPYHMVACSQEAADLAISSMREGNVGQRFKVHINSAVPEDKVIVFKHVDEEQVRCRMRVGDWRNSGEGMILDLSPPSEVVDVESDLWDQTED